jgi:hypothetical protein
MILDLSFLVEQHQPEDVISAVAHELQGRGSTPWSPPFGDTYISKLISWLTRFNEQLVRHYDAASTRPDGES